MITVPELRAELRLPAEEDHRLEGIRSEVIALWEGRTGRPWNARVGHVEILEPHVALGQDIYLELFPVSAIASVRERGSGDSAWATVAATEYYMIGRRILRRVFGEWDGTTEVTYDGGLVEAPADVKRALLLQAKFLIDRTSDSKLVVRNVFGPQGGATYEEATLHPFFRHLAELHRRVA